MVDIDGEDQFRPDMTMAPQYDLYTIKDKSVLNCHSRWNEWNESMEGERTRAEALELIYKVGIRDAE